MTIYDITVPLSPATLVWPGDPPVEVERLSRIEAGDGYNLSALRLSSHAGTHVDPPLHFFQHGAAVDSLPLELLLGPAWLADCRGHAAIGAALLERAAIPAGTLRLLLLTDNSARWGAPSPSFRSDFVALDPSGARWVAERGIRLLGVDGMSVDPPDDGEAVAHRMLLASGTILIENLDLRAVPPDQLFELLCLPLKLAGGDGAPARVVLRG